MAKKRNIIERHSREMCGFTSMAECNAAKLKAVTRGMQTIGRMKSEGWFLRVWENLGWHWAIENGPFTVWEPRKGEGFLCLLSDNLDDTYPVSGSGHWSGNHRERIMDPNKAAAAELKHAKSVVDGLVATLAVAESLLKAKS